MMLAPDGSSAFNAWLEEKLRGIAKGTRAALGEDLEALILGGGYGRGEGGVVTIGGVERPYNDLDFVLVTRRGARRVAERLEPVRNAGHAELGIEVDFSRPLTHDDIRRWPPLLRWHDLFYGHIVMDGPPEILNGLAPDAVRRAPPPIEAARLLLNRGAGLVLCLRVLQGMMHAPDADFLRRNYFKGIQAMGDALLILHGRYQVPYRGRDVVLNGLLAELAPPWGDELRGDYERALLFKFRPDAVPPEQPARREFERLARLWLEVFLHVERERLDGDWDSAQAYAADSRIREPHEQHPRHWLRNLYRSAGEGSPSLRYPREELYRELPIVLDQAARGGEIGGDASARVARLYERYN